VGAFSLVIVWSAENSSASRLLRRALPLKVNEHNLPEGPARTRLICPLFLVDHLIPFMRPGHTMTLPSWLLCGLILASSRIRRVSSASICYDASGSEDQRVPCDPTAADSACCTPGEVCYSNGLCGIGPKLPNNGLTTFYTSTCTDPFYNASVCFSNCNTSMSTSKRGKGPALHPYMIANQSRV
jgi:hypothetical protein